MSDKNNTGPQEGVKGVVEDVKGKTKEAVGTVTGRDDLVREGKAQQDKADAQRDVAKKEAEAEANDDDEGEGEDEEAELSTRDQLRRRLDAARRRRARPARPVPPASEEEDEPLA